MVTLKDVAERAGVSVRTVSNVVNDWPHVRPAMRARVQTVIDDLGYKPNLAARSLRKGRSGLVALIVPEIDVPYFAELTRCVVEEFSARGMTVVVEQTDGDLARERELIERETRMLFDGIIFSPLAMSSAEILARGGRASTGTSSIPLVLIGEQLGAEFDHVLIDNIAAAQLATQHLIELGRRRIALIGRQPGAGINTSELRVEGYKAALRAAGLPIDYALTPATSRFSRLSGATITLDLLTLDDPPDAIFCLNDLLAIGALRTLNRSGVRVPEQVAVIGFDDIDEGRFATPSLSTIAPDKQAIAREAAALLLARIEGSTAPPSVVHVDFELRARETTGHADTLDLTRCIDIVAHEV